MPKIELFLRQIVNKRARGREAKQGVIEAAARAPIGKPGKTRPDDPKN